MPEPTTHTDILVPQPSSEDPSTIHDVGPVRVRVTLEATNEGSPVDKAVDVKVAEGTEVGGVTRISQLIGREHLVVTAAIAAAAHELLEMRGSPEGSVDAMLKDAVRFDWDRTQYLKSLQIEVQGSLGDLELEAELHSGRTEDVITLSTKAGPVATLTVSIPR